VELVGDVIGDRVGLDLGRLVWLADGGFAPRLRFGARLRQPPSLE
jgi:hypothetical protein